MTKEFPWFDEIRMCHMANIEVTQLQVCQHYCWNLAYCAANLAIPRTGLFPDDHNKDIQLLFYTHLWNVSCILFRIQLSARE